MGDRGFFPRSPDSRHTLMMREEWRYVCAKNGAQRIYFSPGWSRPVAPPKVGWILPAYAQAIFLKKTFIIGLSLALAFYPAAPVFVIADDDARPDESITESAEPEPEEEPVEESVPQEEEPTSEETPETVVEPAVVVDELSAPEETSEVSEESSCEEEEPGAEDSGSTIGSCNEAEAKTDVEAASDTGDNSVINEEPEGTEGAAVEPTDVQVESDSAIDTGDAGAAATAVNDVNTNIVGTDVEKEMIIKDGSDDEDIDLLGTFIAGDEEPVDIEAALDGGSGGLSVENGNMATVENIATATAETGSNAIEGGGIAAIDTGDADALAAAINIVNTTLVGSNGLLAIVNIVGDYVGDIILPGEGLLSFGDGNAGGLETVENENEATIENTVIASADTGGNVVEDSGTATVETGDAVAVAESETIANTNFVGDNWLVVVVNVFGEWLGGIVDGEDADGDGVIGFLFGGGEGIDADCETDCADIVSVTGKNVAYIKNIVTATADTGGNTITGADDATIATGNASATAAAFNFVNNNVIGSNWLLGIVNVFGSWGGDLVFGYPDLATSVSDGRESALPGDTLEYELRVENGGKADAENVKVSFRIPDSSEFRSATGGADRGGDMVSWTIENLKKGESMGFSVKVSVRGDAPDGEDLLAYAQAETGTAEKHPENNASDDSTRIDIPDRITDIDADDDAYHTGLRVRRSKPEGSHRGGESITHWITVENTGKHEAREVVVSDAFETPDGTIIAKPLWLVGSIKSGKGVRIEYTIVIPDQVGAGQYRYTAKAEGRQRDDEEIESKKAYAMLTVAGSAFASTFGAETVEAAPPDDLSVPGEVRGAEAATIADIADKKTLPLWMLLLSGLAYALMLNWSFFPSPYRRNL